MKKLIVSIITTTIIMILATINIYAFTIPASPMGFENQIHITVTNNNNTVNKYYVYYLDDNSQFSKLSSAYLNRHFDNLDHPIFFLYFKDSTLLSTQLKSWWYDRLTNTAQEGFTTVSINQNRGTPYVNTLDQTQILYSPPYTNVHLWQPLDFNMNWNIQHSTIAITNDVGDPVFTLGQNQEYENPPNTIEEYEYVPVNPTGKIDWMPTLPPQRADYPEGIVGDTQYGFDTLMYWINYPFQLVISIVKQIGSMIAYTVVSIFQAMGDSFQTITSLMGFMPTTLISIITLGFMLGIILRILGR